jgi:hypothetical protein
MVTAKGNVGPVGGEVSTTEKETLELDRRNRAMAEKLRNKDKGNPGKPPKQWYVMNYNRLIKNGWVPKEADKIIKDQWHNKFNDEKRAFIIRTYGDKEPSKEEYHSEKTNPKGSTMDLGIAGKSYLEKSKEEDRIKEHIKDFEKDIKHHLDELFHYRDDKDRLIFEIDTIINECKFYKNKIMGFDVLDKTFREAGYSEELDKSIENAKELLKKYKRE